jgi:hypothetical protein
MRIAEPPFQINDIDCEGFWLKPDARDYGQRVKKMKSKVSTALVILLTGVERVRLRTIVGEGQGGLVAAMSTFPVILKRSCRDRAVTQHQMQTFRQAWSGITSVLVIVPTSIVCRRFRFSCLKKPSRTWIGISQGTIGEQCTCHLGT